MSAGDALATRNMALGRHDGAPIEYSASYGCIFLSEKGRKCLVGLSVSLGVVVSLHYRVYTRYMMEGHVHRWLLAFHARREWKGWA